uniref:Putative secreted protein n=1 Tax=Ixodes ricinus TaxID=34613 RepID=A0A6B0UMD6_IXORI
MATWCWWSCTWSLPLTYTETVGVGTPTPMHMTVMLMPSIMGPLGITRGRLTKAGMAASVHARTTSEEGLVMPPDLALTDRAYWVLNVRFPMMMEVKGVVTLSHADWSVVVLTGAKRTT